MAWGDLGRTSDEAADLTQAGVLSTASVSTISASTLTTIVTHTAIGFKYISKISCSGILYAKYTLVLNSTVIDTKWGSPDRKVDFDFGGALKLNDSDILDVKVIHYSVGDTADFHATIYGV